MDQKLASGFAAQAYQIRGNGQRLRHRRRSGEANGCRGNPKRKPAGDHVDLSRDSGQCDILGYQKIVAAAVTSHGHQ